jgi:phosphoribosyl 1,2-cyclic phosphodiesterase
MSLFVASLNSGSNGNCYYVGNEQEAVLVDAGISCRETERRMRKIGLSMANVKAIFISHEHGDHIRGVEVLSRRYQVPVYITEKTLRYTKVDTSLVRHFSTHDTVEIGSLSVKAFPKAHDAIDPHSFNISGNGVTVGVFTDIGAECSNVIDHFKQCHACFLETNYDEMMLETGRYPHHLKNRIRGGEGHLSNRQALELFMQHKPRFMTHLFLSHLSRDNNDPLLVYDTFASENHNVQIVVASRYNESEVYRITGTHEPVKIPPRMRPVQATLF